MHVTLPATSATLVPLHKIFFHGLHGGKLNIGTSDAAEIRKIFCAGVNMDNLNKGNTSDIGLTGTTTDTGSFTGDWNLDQQWWRENFTNRPYVSADRRFEDYEPGYRFGYESANRYRGKSWNDAEPTLRTDWDRFEGRGSSTWESMKDAVRDAWDSITGKR
jgi:hypothetical protein